MRANRPGSPADPTHLGPITAALLGAVLLGTVSCDQAADPTANRFEPVAEIRTDNDPPVLQAYIAPLPRHRRATPPPAPAGEGPIRRAAFGGELHIACSEVAVRALPSLEDTFAQRNGKPHLRLQVTSDRAAVKRVLAGTAAGALIASELTVGERDQGMIAYPVADHVLAVVGHPDLEFSNIDQTHMRQILTGTINHWSWVGSDAGHLALVLPRPGAMADLVADEFVPGNPLTDRSVRYDSEAEGLSLIRTTTGAVGIVSLAAAEKAADGVKVLMVDSCRPSGPLLRGGHYPFGRTIHLACRGTPNSELTALLEALAALRQGR